MCHLRGSNLQSLTGWAVSYTHLDVYKRQDPSNPVVYTPLPGAEISFEEPKFERPVLHFRLQAFLYFLVLMTLMVASKSEGYQIRASPLFPAEHTITTSFL